MRPIGVFLLMITIPSMALASGDYAPPDGFAVGIVRTVDFPIEGEKNPTTCYQVEITHSDLAMGTLGWFVTPGGPGLSVNATFARGHTVATVGLYIGETVVIEFFRTDGRFVIMAAYPVLLRSLDVRNQLVREGADVIMEEFLLSGYTGQWQADLIVYKPHSTQFLLDAKLGMVNPDKNWVELFSGQLFGSNPKQTFGEYMLDYHERTMQR